LANLFAGGAKENEMSASNILIILGCLVAGYFFTSRIIDSRDVEPDNAANTNDAPPEPPPIDSQQTTDMPLSARDCYDILGVSAGARAEEIRLAYQRKIAQYHPDKVMGLGEKIQTTAELESKRINRAYDYLKSRGYA
jgi:DnaJ-domain-containing protein 1